jgi:hypothetical protein
MVDRPDPAEDDEIPGEDADPAYEQVKEQERRADEVSQNAAQLKAAWRDTIEDMEAIAAEWRGKDYDVVDIVSVDAGPIGRDSNDDEGEYGMEFVIADNDVDAFVDAFEAGEFPQYDIYRGEVSADAFVVEELVDHEEEVVILLAGAYAIREETMCAYAAREEGEMFTFVRTLDGTRYGAFRHEGYEKFFPRADELPDDPMDFELA